MSYVNDWIVKGSLVPVLARKVSPVVWTEYAEKNLTPENKQCIRAVWETGYNLSVTPPYMESPIHAAYVGLDFGTPPDGDLSQIYKAFLALEDDWPGGLSISIPPAYKHLHVDLWPNGKAPRFARFVELAFKPYRQVVQSENPAEYDRLVKKAAAYYPDPRGRVPDAGREKPGLREEAEGLYRDLKTGVKWSFYLAAASLGVSLLRTAIESAPRRRWH